MDLLTVREIARLQGYEDGFAFYGSESSQRIHALSAIPPIIAQNVAQAIRQAVNGMRVVTASKGNKAGSTSKRPRLED
jgi:site-specific DNA-cytosine methylase